MAELPGSGPQLPQLQFFDDDGAPVAGGKLFTYIVGTSTKKATYTDANLNPMNVNTNPVILDASGRCVMFLANDGGYKFVLSPSTDTDPPTDPIWTQDQVENVAEVTLSEFGIFISRGSRDVTSGYVTLATDRLITVDSSGGAATINLLAASDATNPLVVKNLGANTVTVTPDGGDTIDGLASFVIAAASSPTYPAITLYPDGISNWVIASSHGL